MWMPMPLMRRRLSGRPVGATFVLEAGRRAATGPAGVVAGRAHGRRGLCDPGSLVLADGVRQLDGAGWGAGGRRRMPVELARETGVAAAAQDLRLLDPVLARDAP